MELAKDIAEAKNIPEIHALQTNFAQNQMQAYAQQTQERGRLMTEATVQAAETL